MTYRNVFLSHMIQLSNEHPLPQTGLMLSLSPGVGLWSVNQVKSLMVVSAPQENTQGCWGWNTQSRTPRSRDIVWPFRIFTGTIRGFFSKSLNNKKKKDQCTSNITTDFSIVYFNSHCSVHMFHHIFDFLCCGNHFLKYHCDEVTVDDNAILLK